MLAFGSTKMSKMSDADLIASPFLFDLKRHFARLSHLLYLEVIEYDTNSTEYQTYFMLYKYDDDYFIDNKPELAANFDESKYSKSESMESHSPTHYINNIDTKLIIDRHSFRNLFIYHKLLETMSDINILFDYIVTHNIHYIESHNLKQPQFISYNQLLLFINHDRSLLSRAIRIIYDQLFIAITHNRYDDILQHYLKNSIIASPQNSTSIKTNSENPIDKNDKNDKNFEFDKRIRDKIIKQEISTPIHKLFVPQLNKSANYYNISSSMLIPWLDYITQTNDDVNDAAGISTMNDNADMANMGKIIQQNRREELLLNLLLATMTFNILVDCMIFSYLIPISPFIAEQLSDKNSTFTILFYVSLIISSYQFGQFLGKIIFNKLINTLSWIVSSYSIVNMMIFIALFTNILCQLLMPIAVYQQSVSLILLFRFVNGLCNHQYYYFKIFITSPLFSKTVKKILSTKYRIKSFQKLQNIRDSKVSQSSSLNKAVTNGRNASDSEPDLHFALHPKQGSAFDATTTQFKYSKWLHSFIANTLIITQLGCILGLLYGAFTYKYGSFAFVPTFYGYLCDVDTSHPVKVHQDRFAVTCFILFLSCTVSTFLYSKFVWAKYGKLFVEKDEEQSLTYLNTEQIISFLQKTLSDKKQCSSRCFHLFLASYIVANNLQALDTETAHSLMGSVFEKDSEHPYISRLTQSFSSISTVNKSPSKVRRMSPANKYFKYRNNANNRKIVKIRRQQQKTLAIQLKKNKKKVQMNLLKRKVKHLLIFSHFIIACVISWFDFGFLFVLYVSSDKQGYNFDERQIALVLLVPYCTLMIWIPVGSKIFYVLMNAERRCYMLLLSAFCALFIGSTFISTLLFENNDIKHWQCYTWITLICVRAIMTILLSSILAMIDYKLHQLLLTYSVIVLQIDHVDYFSMSISLVVLILLIFGIDQLNCDKYLFSITYTAIIFCLLLCTIIPYIVSEMILYGKYSKTKDSNSNTLAAVNSYKVLSKTYKKRKQNWRTKIQTLQNYVYIRSLLSHYGRTPNTTPSLTLALQHVKFRKQRSCQHGAATSSAGGAASSLMASEYVLTQPASDINISGHVESGSHANDDFALVFSATSHTNYTNIEYMDANVTPSVNNLRRATLSQTRSNLNYNYEQTPQRDLEAEHDETLYGVDDDKIVQQQQDKEQSFKLAQQIISIAGQTSEEMKLNISALQTIQISGLDVGINEPDKYISDIDCIIAAIIALYNEYFRYYSLNDRFLMEGRLHFDASLRAKIKKGEAVHLIYIGFPFKLYQFDDDFHNNADLEYDYEYLSGVDMADLFILQRLNEFCLKINEIYAYKSYCSIISMAPFVMDVVYDHGHKKKMIEFCRLIINYYLDLGKIINDGNKEDDLFEYLEWYDVLRINAENKYTENADTDTDIDNVTDTDTFEEDTKMLNRYKNLVESFSLQHKIFPSTIFNALKSNNNLKQTFLKLNDWINMVPVEILIHHNEQNEKKNKEVQILNEKAIRLLKSYLRLLVWIESQLKHSIIFSSMASNNECSSIIFSAFQSCKLGFSLSLFQINKEQYKLDKLNYYNCYASNQMIFIIDDDDINNINISFMPLDVLNFSDFEWKKNKNVSNDSYEYIVFSLDGSLKFKMIKLSNIRNKNEKICNHILKAWKLKECVFDIQEYYCLQMQSTK